MELDQLKELAKDLREHDKLLDRLRNALDSAAKINLKLSEAFNEGRHRYGSKFGPSNLAWSELGGRGTQYTRLKLWEKDAEHRVDYTARVLSDIRTLEDEQETALELEAQKVRDLERLKKMAEKAKAKKAPNAPKVQDDEKAQKATEAEAPAPPEIPDAEPEDSSAAPSAAPESSAADEVHPEFTTDSTPE